MSLLQQHNREQIEYRTMQAKRSVAGHPVNPPYQQHPTSPPKHRELCLQFLSGMCHNPHCPRLHPTMSNSTPQPNIACFSALGSFHDQQPRNTEPRTTQPQFPPFTHQLYNPVPPQRTPPVKLPPRFQALARNVVPGPPQSFSSATITPWMASPARIEATTKDPSSHLTMDTTPDVTVKIASHSPLPQPGFTPNIPHATANNLTTPSLQGSSQNTPIPITNPLPPTEARLHSDKTPIPRVPDNAIPSAEARWGVYPKRPPGLVNGHGSSPRNSNLGRHQPFATPHDSRNPTPVPADRGRSLVTSLAGLEAAAATSMPSMSSHPTQIGLPIVPTTLPATSSSSNLKEGNTMTCVLSHPRPRHFTEKCRDWSKGFCRRGYHCLFIHDDIRYEPTSRLDTHNSLAHPVPRNFPRVCEDWRVRRCEMGCFCPYVHSDLTYEILSSTLSQSEDSKETDTPNVIPQAMQAKSPEIGSFPGLADDQTDSSSATSVNGYSTPPSSPERSFSTLDNAVVVHESSDGAEEKVVEDVKIGRPRPPCYPNICRVWLRNCCLLGYSCRFVHGDLDYDVPEVILPTKEKESEASKDAKISDNDKVDAPIQHDAPPAPSANQNSNPTFRSTLHDHIKVNFANGFGIREITTGFESCWVHVGNIPAHITEKRIIRLLERRGELVETLLPRHPPTGPYRVRAHFANHEEALKAVSKLNGASKFDVRLTARLAITNTSKSRGELKDTSVRIQWELPAKTAYAGYKTTAQAEEAMEKARQPFLNRTYPAMVFVGLPAVSDVTVRIRSLPPDITREQMSWFSNPDDVVWEDPTYKDLSYATRRIQSILGESGPLVSFDVLPPPHRDGLVTAWATFSSSAEAEAACGRLNGRKPLFVGRTKIIAQHLKSFVYTFSQPAFQQIHQDVEALIVSFRDKPANISIIRRDIILVKLSSSSIKDLARLKAEFDMITQGEIVRDVDGPLWDPSFMYPDGVAFVHRLQLGSPRVTIHRDFHRRVFRLFGPPEARQAVKSRLLAKVQELRSQKVRFITLNRRYMGKYMVDGFTELQRKIGLGNVTLDAPYCRVIVRGSEKNYVLVQETIRAAEERYGRSNDESASNCPVCFNNATAPVTLPCQHSWCHSCFVDYLKAAADNNLFPLTCLGNNAKCTEKLSVFFVKKHLPEREFESLLNAALSAHVRSRPKEFHYCPTPDCQQIYRAAPPGTTLQCPTCLLRICSHCNIEAHDGFECRDIDGGDLKFQEWAKEHNVKPCPGCNIAIERSEGCNHLTCTQCKTHICWECMATFPQGQGIYHHMRSEHGGIGVDPIII